MPEPAPRLANLDRARELMARDGFDALLAALPVNQYYLSSYWGLFNTPVGYDGSYFSLLPRAPDAPAALVLPALEIRRLETTGGTWVPGVFAYSTPDETDYFPDGTPRGSDYSGWPVRDGAALEPLEQRWVAITRSLGRSMSPDAFWALARALRAADLHRGRLAVDDARLALWLGDREPGVECVYRPQLFNEIRLVKTPAELELLRHAARINETALLKATEALREGIAWPDVENVYMMEMARQGGRGVYLMCGVGELPAGGARRGEPVMFDGLGQFARYHGDFGRCAVIGAPAAGHRERHRALVNGWETALEFLRPGIRYSELSQAVGAAVRRSGLGAFRDPIVHSLGLEHTDDPKPHGVQPQSKPDQILLAGMVVNVDMPHTEIGWGSVHMEDTVHIRPDGPELLTSNDVGLRIIG